MRLIEPYQPQPNAYLRLGKVEFCIQECSSSSTPTGVIPAVDTGTDVPAAAEAGDLAAARAIIAALSKSSGPSAGPLVDLDAALSPAQRAELLAFTALLSSKLDVATNYTTWIEKRGYREFRKAYQEAVEVLAAVADRLRASSGRFFFGNAPSSLDALLFGHLAFYRHSPVAAPILREKVDQQQVLCRYVDNILRDYFSTEMPPPPADDPAAGSSWSEAAQGHSSAPKQVPTVEEVRMWKGSQYWLAGAAAAVGAYVLLGGQYFTISTIEDDADVDDEDDDDVVLQDSTDETDEEDESGPELLELPELEEA
eukprot:gene11272-11423_t